MNIKFIFIMVQKVLDIILLSSKGHYFLVRIRSFLAKTGEENRENTESLAADFFLHKERYQKIGAEHGLVNDEDKPNLSLDELKIFIQKVKGLGGSFYV